ncbi:MAG: antA/AntB antirepressor family protein [Neisseriaceae bacterium]|nr:antA/AntB antirepressor family protein [Neisseriaceae bacterium]MBR1819256.1 antA/AntB antirepressor family protein [Neisseriaceae bacterium]
MTESQNLIAVFNGEIGGESQMVCNARELHGFLQSSQDFSTWIKNRIEKYGFVENQDYLISENYEINNFAPQNCGAKNDNQENRGGHNRIDYHITLDMAKELAMVERNEMGRKIRRYFIECEKRLRGTVNNGNLYSLINPEKQVLLPKKDHIELFHIQWLRDEIGRCYETLPTIYKALVKLQSPLAAEMTRANTCFRDMGTLCNFLVAGISEFERRTQTTL